jgi:hypothetical protein
LGWRIGWSSDAGLVALRHHARMTPSSEERDADYGDLHVTTVDAIRYVPAGQSIEEAADEFLQRLREAGPPIPDRP